MTVFVGPETLIGQALIFLQKNGIREVDWLVIVEYGRAISRLYRTNNTTDLVFMLSRDDIAKMDHYWSDFFDIQIGNLGQCVFRLKAGVDADSFSDYIEIGEKLKQAFTSPEALRVLGVL